jgi:RimJ/RimL family protein N-acetyltransferase
VTTTTDVIVQSGKWRAVPMILNMDKIEWLWAECNKFRTLFSDITRGNTANFMNFLLQPQSMWFEILDKDDVVVGIIWLSDMELVVEANVHMMFFDRKAEEKVDVCRELMKWAFRNLPLQRITAPIPSLYFGTHRLAELCGFRHEGTKRRALLMGGKWVDMRIYGITRPEVEL